MEGIFTPLNRLMGANSLKPPLNTPSGRVREFCKNRTRVGIVESIHESVISENTKEDTISRETILDHEDVEVSEGGLSNIMSDFQDIGLIIQEEDDESSIQYRVTESGKIIFEDYFKIIDKFETMADEELQHFLNEIPNWDEVLCSPEFLGDATIKESESIRVNEARRRYIDLVSNSNSIRELVPQLFFPEVFEGREKDLEFIVTEEVMNIVSEDDLIEGAQYYTVNRDIPYTLSIFDEEIVGIIPPMEDDPNKFLYTDNENVLKWAQQQYDDFLDDADPYQPRSSFG